MGRSKKLSSLSKVETTDVRTGEVTVMETTKTWAIPIRPENFYMVFIGAMQGFYKIECLTDVKVLAKLCEKAEFNTGRVQLTTQMRKQIMNELQIPTQTVSNSLSRLKKLKLLDGERGTYDINPTVIWKGDTNTRAALIKAKGKLILSTHISE